MWMTCHLGGLLAFVNVTVTSVARAWSAARTYGRGPYDVGVPVHAGGHTLARASPDVDDLPPRWVAVY